MSDPFRAVLLSSTDEGWLTGRFMPADSQAAFFEVVADAHGYLKALWPDFDVICSSNVQWPEYAVIHFNTGHES